MLAGNTSYEAAADVPHVIPVFPLTGAVLLPRVHMPLNIFEPRYLAMIDAVLGTHRAIGIVQPRFDDKANEMKAKPDLCQVGGLGRIVSFQETGDGRYIISLAGVCRFRIAEELAVTTPFRQCKIDVTPFESDLETGEKEVDRASVIRVFKDFLAANELEADWKRVQNASNEALVNTLAMISPWGPAEKQALLEAPDLQARADTLVAITEVQLARQDNGEKSVLN